LDDGVELRPVVGDQANPLDQHVVRAPLIPLAREAIVHRDLRSRIRAAALEVRMDSERAPEQIGGFAERAERQTAEALGRCRLDQPREDGVRLLDLLALHRLDSCTWGPSGQDPMSSTMKPRW